MLYLNNNLQHYWILITYQYIHIGRRQQQEDCSPPPKRPKLFDEYTSRPSQTPSRSINILIWRSQIMRSVFRSGINLRQAISEDIMHACVPDTGVQSSSRESSVVAGLSCGHTNLPSVTNCCQTFRFCIAIVNLTPIYFHDYRPAFLVINIFGDFIYCIKMMMIMSRKRFSSIC